MCARLGQSLAIEKFLCNALPPMMHIPKLSYFELLIFFRDAMPSELYERVYLDRDGCLLVGSLDENNKTSSTFHDEALQMSMI